MSVTTSSGPTSRVYFSQRLRLHYVDWGNPSAPPLLLLHGGRDHCRNWDWVATALRDEYHVIAPDLRGHGNSAWSASGHYTMASYIYDLAQLVHQQELAPVAIVAHSLGGNIATRYAGVYPDAVRRLVVIEGIGPPPRPPGVEAAPDRSTNACATGSTNSARCRDGCRDATPRSRTRCAGCRRRTRTSPLNRRGI